MHHGGHSKVDANPTGELTSPNTHRQAFKSTHFWKLMIFNPNTEGWFCSTLLFPPFATWRRDCLFTKNQWFPVNSKSGGLVVGFLRKDIKYCKACSKIAGVGKSAAVIIKSYYSLWSCRIFTYGWHPSAWSQQTRCPSTQTPACRSGAREHRQHTSLTSSTSACQFGCLKPRHHLQHLHGISRALLMIPDAATAQNTTSFSCMDYKSGEGLVFT